MPEAPVRASRVLVGIVHWNTPELLVRCLAALDGLPRYTVTVVVLDNASASGLPEGLAGHSPSVQVRMLPQNLGYAGAAALATTLVLRDSFDALWLLNADVVAEPGAFAALAEVSARYPDAVVGSVVLDSTGHAPRMPEKFLHADRRWRFGRRDRPVPLSWFDTPVRSVQSVHGASMWFPRQALERVGGPDPDLFLYCEELDFCLRATRAGIPVLIAGASRVRHAGGGSTRARPEVDRMLDYYRVRNELVLWRRHAPCWLPWIAVRKLASALAGTLRGHAGTSWRWAGIIDGLLGRLGKRHAPESALKTR